MFLGLFRFFKRNNFSVVHKSHVDCEGVYLLHFFKITNFISGSGCSCFSQMYWDRAVAFFWIGVRNE